MPRPQILAFPVGEGVGEADGRGALAFFPVIPRAYAVSILPFGKTLDLQGGFSSSQKSRCAAIFGSPIMSRAVERVS